MKTSSAEPVKRIPYANSAPRHIKVLGLGERAKSIVQELIKLELPTLEELSGEKDPSELDLSTNTVIAILQHGADLEPLHQLFARTSKRGVLMTAVLLTHPSKLETNGNWFRLLRESSDMLVITADHQYPRELVDSLIASESILREQKGSSPL